ncbi:ATP-binding cassette subfamily F protein 3 [Acetoanaerobium pronyense]|uniref:ATP-binding cassette subfamily F protein 3 n=1 Tax=Acetoanaerobium pronyense TaxID=1482736 RepID=A0ABS4KKT1_9FIRM|nr:ATP-binding cassette domain-containing protein [Acetoanaerobium pronyense]MBP2028390.1 ATP-binding cassette subfamily F protein 3 [Acetoanaerobium pronyense]
MIQVYDLSYSTPEKDLYNKISFTLKKGQHCALIGASGTGKSTLIDMIIDSEKYLFDGSLIVEPDCKIGYVRQFYESDKNSSLTVFEYIAKDFINLESELLRISDEMVTSSDLEPLLEKYQEISDAFEAIGGDNYENIINKKLNLSSLMNCKDLNISQISGGEFKLIQIIKTMLSLPDLMIMDEPDVFLDFDNLNSLKKLINSYKGTMLIVTHNRYLLNHCFDKIIHLENTEIQEFDGRYIDYKFSLLQSKIETLELANADTEEIQRNELLIDKFRAAAGENANASIGQHVNSRVKIQERLLARRIKAPFVDINQPNIVFPSNEINIENKEKIALEVSDLNISFDDALLENINFEIKSNDKAAIIGPNGTGKTTLLQYIAKNDHPSIKFDEGINVAYLSQIKGETLDESSTVNEEFFNAGFKTYDEIISCIRKYGFDGEIATKKIGSLSGGEKNILQIAKFSKEKTDMLILDEPTSHLDTYSQIALEKAIEGYKGAILMVSHDFYTISNCMDYVLLIEDKNIRKVNMKKFRQMIYKNHFDKDYLEIEKKKKEAEIEIDMALNDNDFELAKSLSIKLESILKSF